MKVEVTEGPEKGKVVDIAAKPVKEDYADQLLRKYHFITLIETDELYYYNGGVYNNHGEALVKKEVQNIDGRASAYDRNEVVGKIKALTYKSLNEVGAPTHNTILIQNGLLDISTRELRPFSPSVFSTYKLPIAYNPEAQCPAIDKFFREIVALQDIPALYEFFGYCLLKDYPIQAAFMLLGDGDNGKSTLLRLLSRFLGQSQISSVGLQELVDDQFARAALYNKLANIHADISATALRDTGWFKMLTGGDSIRANPKYGRPFDFTNYAKLIFSANSLPYTYDTTYAFYKRWVIINFPNKFDKTRRDKAILDKLSTPEELSGLLNKTLEGLHRLLEKGEFSNQKSVEDTQEQYIRLSDSVGAFVLDHVECAPEKWIPKKLLYQLYLTYCKLSNLPAISEKTFFQRLNHHIKVEDYNASLSGQRIRSVKGIVLKVDMDSYSLQEYVQYVQDVHDLGLLLQTSKGNSKINNKEKPEQPEQNPPDVDTSSRTQEGRESLELGSGRETSNNLPDESGEQLERGRELGGRGAPNIGVLEFGANELPKIREEWYDLGKPKHPEDPQNQETWASELRNRAEKAGLDMSRDTSLRLVKDIFKAWGWI